MSLQVSPSLKEYDAFDFSFPFSDSLYFFCQKLIKSFFLSKIISEPFNLNRNLLPIGLNNTIFGNLIALICVYIHINAAGVATAQVISFFKSEEGSIIRSSECPNPFFFNLSTAFFRCKHIDFTNEIE